MSGCVIDRSLYRAFLSRAHRRCGSKFFSSLGEKLLVKYANNIDADFSNIFKYGTFALHKECNVVADFCGTDLSFDEETMAMRQDFDLVLSNLSLHMVNSLHEALSNYKKLLKNGGIFISVIIGQNSLVELKKFIAEVELNANRPISPRIFPMIETKNFSALLQKAEFQNISVIKETYEIDYDIVMKLINDIRDLGQSNCLMNSSRSMLSRDFYVNCMEQGIKVTMDFLVGIGMKINY